MGLFLIGLALVIIGAMMLFAPGTLSRGAAVAVLVGGAVLLEVSRADRYAYTALIVLAVGAAYFINRKPVVIVEDEPEIGADDGEE